MPVTARARAHQRFLTIAGRNIDRFCEEKLARISVEDQSPTGEWISMEGRKVLNFGSCAYLGLNVDPRLKEGAIEAIESEDPQRGFEIGVQWHPEKIDDAGQRALFAALVAACSER